MSKLSFSLRALILVHAGLSLCMVLVLTFWRDLGQPEVLVLVSIVAVWLVAVGTILATKHTYKFNLYMLLAYGVGLAILAGGALYSGLTWLLIIAFAFSLLFIGFHMVAKKPWGKDAPYISRSGLPLRREKS